MIILLRRHLLEHSHIHLNTYTLTHNTPIQINNIDNIYILNKFYIYFFVSLIFVKWIVFHFKLVLRFTLRTQQQFNIHCLYLISLALSVFKHRSNIIIIKFYIHIWNNESDQFSLLKMLLVFRWYCCCYVLWF